VWTSTDEVADRWQLDRRCTPQAEPADADARHRRWRAAVERSRGWARPR
jgi:glycerol kinase